MKKSIQIIFMTSLLIVLSACNRFRTINEEISELDAEKDDVVVIGKTSLFKNGKDYLLDDLFQELMTTHSFSIQSFTHEPPYNHYQTYLDGDIYYLFVLTDHKIDDKFAYALIAINLNTFDTHFIDYYTSTYWQEALILITVDGNYLLLFHYESSDLSIYHKETFEHIRTTHYEVDSPSDYPAYIEDGVLYFYLILALPRIEIQVAYDYITGEETDKRDVTIEKSPVNGASIEINGDYYQFFPNAENYQELFLYINSIKYGVAKINDLVSGSDRGSYILDLIKKRGNSLTPNYIYITTSHNKFYFTVQYAEGVKVHDSLFGKTPYLMFEFDYLMDTIKYVGSSSVFGSVFVDLHDQEIDV